MKQKLNKTTHGKAIIYCLVILFTLSSLAAVLPSDISNQGQNQSGYTEKNASNRLQNGLALTPPMGFNNWARYQCGDDFNENTFIRIADTLVNNGLAAKGYVYITVDDCWMKKERDADGNLVVDDTRFPNGMKWLGDALHQKGLKFGIYQNGGTQTCAGYPGSFGYFQQDANLFAEWGVDYIKFDFCNPPPTAEGSTFEVLTRQIYSEMSAAITASGRPMIFSESAPAYFVGGEDYTKVMDWVGLYGHLWRVTNDIPNHNTTDKWEGIISNYEGNVTLAAYAGPGSWNDPDFLIIGDDDNDLATIEQRSQMSLWAIMAAPLILSTNVDSLTSSDLAILGNEDVIAIDQDSLGIQGTRVLSENGVDVIAKRLSNGDIATALFNKENPNAVNATIHADTIGFNSPGCYSVKNLWTGIVTQTTDEITVNLPEHDTALLRVSESTGCGVTDPTSTPVNLISVEGESGEFKGAAKTGLCLACSGGRLAGFIGGGPDNSMTLAIDAGEGGTKNLNIYYVIEGTRKLYISVNGDAGASFDLSSDSWNRPAVLTLVAQLAPGVNTFRFYNDSDFAPSIDRITIQ